MYKDRYFKWLVGIVGNNNYYSELLNELHSIPFKPIMAKDINRKKDGYDLRGRFARHIKPDGDFDDWNAIQMDLSGRCSILEMMIALAIRCEETIMDDPTKGNRTAQWFWKMINNLGLSQMDNERFDKKYVDMVIRVFNNRDYESDGTGGLFRIKNCDKDMRNIEIWNQLCYYLDTLI